MQLRCHWLYSAVLRSLRDSSLRHGHLRCVKSLIRHRRTALLITGFVLGFVIGPLLWAPMSEVLGRRKLFIGTYILFTAFNGGVIASQNIWTLIILRFLAGTAGSSPLTNAGGTVSDVFSAGERGLGMAIFAAAPFAGPAVGPIVSAMHRPIA